MSGFAAAVAAFSDRAVKQCHEVRREVFIDLATSIVNDTPVSDEETAPGKPHGFLKGNWQTAINRAPIMTIPLRDAVEVLADIENISKDAAGDDVLILRNNTIYGPGIEYEGWSWQKAPQGMVRVNVARFQQALKSAILAARGMT